MVDQDANRDSRPPLADGAGELDSFLDELFERALEDFERGEKPELEPWLIGREGLRERVVELVELAREVAVHAPRAPRDAPSVAGFEIERELGQGAMGAVYLARQRSLGGRRVALKVLPPALALSARAKARFLAEARALAKLSHPGVVAVHEVVDAESVLAYAMEWVDGCSLAQIVKAWRQSPGLNERAALTHVLGSAPESVPGLSPILWILRTFAALARALGAVHRAGLLHRDIKPSNILIRRDGAPLLSDFGLARDVESSMHTRTGQYLGTPAYSAPEQLRGEHESIDARSDVYSLGVSLYEALTLRLPYVGRSAAEALTRAEVGAFERPRRRSVRLPRDLETILATAITPERGRRYETADALADDLERLLAFEPIRARRTSAWSRTWKFARRNRASVAATAVASLVVAVLAVWLTHWSSLRARADELARAELARAQQALLDPTHADALFFVAFPSERPPGDPVTPGHPRGTRPTEALEHYARALAIRPSSDVRAKIELEREVVAFADALALGLAPQPISQQMRESCPGTARSMESWDSVEDRAHIEDGELAALSGQDRRHLGLLAFLLGDAGLSIRAWREASLGYPLDPLADASLGLLYLELGEPEEAFPRLLVAFDSYDEAGFLCVALADAALRNGRTRMAEDLLAKAGELALHDPFDTRKRVQADLAVARGEETMARELYEWILERHPGATAAAHYASFLETQGEWEGALSLWRRRSAQRPSFGPWAQDFVDACDRWWSAKDEPPSRILIALLEELPKGPSSGVELLEAYHAALGVVDAVSATEGTEKGADSWSRERANTAPKSGPDSLRTTVQRMDLISMDHRAFLALPSSIRRWMARTWCSPLAPLATGALALISRVRHALDRAAARSAVGALVLPAGAALAAPAGEWPSAWGGPTNERHASGEMLAADWQLEWEAPSFGYVLVQNGIVVHRPTGELPAKFAGVDIWSGREIWRVEPGPGSSLCSPRHNCIVADKLFIGLGMNSCVQLHTQRVERRSLFTGAEEWEWNSGVNGTVRSLQALESPLDDRYEVVFEVDDYVGGSQVWKDRFYSLRALAASPTVVCSVPNQGQNLATAPPGLFRTASNGRWLALFHDDITVPWPGGFHWASKELVTIDLDSCTTPAPPFVSNPSLCGTTLSTELWTNNGQPVVVDADRTLMLQCRDAPSAAFAA